MKSELINAANLLTLSRMVLTPFIVYAILQGDPRVALILMFVAGLTDGLDGYVAKHLGQGTKIGGFLDPIADKMLLVSSFVALYAIGRVPLELFLAVLFRDVMILLGAVAFELVTHRLTMQPTALSKMTTLFQIVYVLLSLFDMIQPLPNGVIVGLAWLTLVLTCASGVHYMVKWTLKALREEGA